MYRLQPFYLIKTKYPRSRFLDASALVATVWGLVVGEGDGADFTGRETDAGYCARIWRDVRGGGGGG